jgi:rhodanese-related sulfurtransferase
MPTLYMACIAMHSVSDLGTEKRLDAGHAIRVRTVFANEVATVRPAEVAARLAEGWMLLDVRTDDEWADGRIAGSVHIPMDQLMQRMDEVDDRVVCVCAVGARSARVAQFLNAQGREAVNLDGGIYAWANSGFSIER